MISEAWKMALIEEMGQKKLAEMMHFIDSEYASKTLYPPKRQVFKAFELDPENIKCVILGQDPYHQKGQAMGLSFSVMPGIAIPRSLCNIYKELQNEYGFDIPDTGCLLSWADQGVFLLNASLCVQDSRPGSYMDIWQPFTDAVIKILNKQTQPIVYMLWGNFARQKAEFITNPEHLVLQAAHPSPFSANKGFFGCGHFLKCNDFLTARNIEPIDWKIEDKETDHG